MIYYRFADECLWKQASKNGRVSRHPVPLVLDPNRSRDETLFNSMLFDFLKPDSNAQAQARLLAPLVLPLLKHSGEWVVSSYRLEQAVTKALVLRTRASAAPRIEIVSASRRDTLRPVR